MTGHTRVPDGEFWARFFPTPPAGDDTIYRDSTHVDAEHLACDQTGHGWFWVVWWRGRPAVSGWADSQTTAAQAAAASTTDPLTRLAGPVAPYLAAVAPACALAEDTG